MENLTKTFEGETVVYNLTLDIYEGDITVFLGHNGAGKTTLMNMLIGTVAPTSGTIKIKDCDITMYPLEARKSLGFCLQHDMLIDDLTVKEHLIFFCRLKGLARDVEIVNEVKKYLKLLNFDSESNYLSKTLSRGMRRKLSVAIALCGGSKIVIFDEPTAGMDTLNQRLVWNLLLEEKKNRTILLTTHHMNEADLLGDRVIIIKEGEYVTGGSPSFLKRLYKSGYKLIFVKNPLCDDEKILNVIEKYAPDSSVLSNSETEVIFHVYEEHVSNFPKMFKDIENQCNVLNFSSFGCSMTSLDEVFMKIACENDENESKNYLNLDQNNFLNAPRHLIGIRSIIYQFYAFFFKNMLFMRQNILIIMAMALSTITIMNLVLNNQKMQETDRASSSDIFKEILIKKTLVTKLYTNSFDPGLVEIMNATSEKFNRLEIVDSDIREDLPSVVNGHFLLDTFLIHLSMLNGSFKVTTNCVQYNYFCESQVINRIHRSLLKQQKGSQFDISSSFKMVSYEDSLRQCKEKNEIFELVWIILLLSFWPMIISVNKIVEERVTRSKNLQFTSGTNRFVFWLSSFLFDMFVVCFISLMMVAALVFYVELKFHSQSEVMTYMLVLTCYHFSRIPLIYSFSSTLNSGYTAAFISSFVEIALYLISILIITTFKEKYYENFEYGVILSLPMTCVKCIMRIRESYCEDGSKIFKFGEEGIMFYLIIFLSYGIILTIFCLIKDHMVIEKYLSHFEKPYQENDILGLKDKHCLKLQNLSKTYRKKVAVDKLNLKVKVGECFGLLGVNGAGKTTTFKMMTGNVLMSSGDAQINGYSIRHQMTKAQKSIGYCPQNDAILLEMTGRELLKMFAFIRGVPKNQIGTVIETLAFELGFQTLLDKKSQNYSGGDKRKLSVALVSFKLSIDVRFLKLLVLSLYRLL